MSIDEATIRHIAHLSRISVSEDEIALLYKEMTSIIGFIDELNEVNTDGVMPMTSAVETHMRMRQDVVNDGGYVTKVMSNTARHEDNYFMVPKVID